MKDMYIDYARNHRRPNRRKQALRILLLIVLVAGLGTGTFFAARYYFDVMDDQEKSAEVPYDLISAAQSRDEELYGEGSETGIYGLWEQEETVESVNSDYDVDSDVWMRDFVDTRTRIDSKGIYVATAFLNNKLDYVYNIADTTEINTMVIDIKESKGYVAYRMDYPMAKEIGALTSTVKDMAGLVKSLKEKNIYLIARIVCMEDPILAKAKPELALYKKDGTKYKDSSGLAWVNPYRQEVWDYITGLATRCVDLGFDEINFDYIRFPTDNGAADIDYGVDTEAYTKTDCITDGIRTLCEKLKPMGVFVSCDVFGTIINSSVDAKLVGQNYFKMAQYLDYICPMIYPSHYANGYYDLDIPDTHPYDLVRLSLLSSKKVLYMIDDTTGNKAIVRPWLQDFTAGWVKGHLNYGPEEVRAQINGVYDSGHTQWLLWNAAINYNVGGLLPKEEEKTE